MGKLKEAVDEFEKMFIISVLNQNNGNVAASAKVMGIPRSTMYRKLNEHGIKIEGVAK